MLVVATNEAAVDDVARRVESLGAPVVDVIACGTHRRLLEADTADEHVAVALRDLGLAAVIRPDGGSRLATWNADAEPVRFADRLTVCPAWSTRDRDVLAGLVEIGPGGFGNGRHPTTRLLIEQLLTRVRGGEEVLDVGCGSGVLGLCALRLGAAGVSAVDIKADAVAATRRNAALNGLDDRLVAGDTLPADPCDVVLANIARDGLVVLADRLKVLVAPGGWLAASGISPAQCSLVAGYLRPLVEVERVVDGEWAVLVVARTFD